MANQTITDQNEDVTVPVVSDARVRLFDWRRWHSESSLADAEKHVGAARDAVLGERV